MFFVYGIIFFFFNNIHHLIILSVVKNYGPMAWKLAEKAKNNIAVNLWASREGKEHFRCILCNTSLKYSRQGFQAIEQHSKHTNQSDLRFNKKQPRFSTQDAACASTEAQKPAIVFNNPALDDKQRVAETMWLFKVAEHDFSFRSCEQLSSLFQAMFPDSLIGKSFTMGRSKASYSVTEALGPMMQEKIYKEVSQTPAAFTILFDETTTLQVRKQYTICSINRRNSLSWVGL